MQVFYWNDKGDVYACGENRYFQISHLELGEIEFPTKLNVPYKIKKIEMGFHHTICLTEENDVIVSGLNKKGRLGLGKKILVVKEFTFINIVSIEDFLKKKKVLKYALVIGMSQYETFSKLQTVKNDCKSMEKLLKSKGFHVNSLSDLDGEDLKDEFDFFISDVQEKITNEKGDEGDIEVIVVFYYAGHGLYNDDSQLLIPIDFNTNLLKVKLKEKAMKDMSEERKIKYMREMMEKQKKKINMCTLNEHMIKKNLSMVSQKHEVKCVLLLDCCRTKVELKINFAMSSGSRSIGKFIISHSTSKGNVAIDKSILGKNSPYCTALLNRLKGSGDLSKLLLLVKEDVTNDTKGNQTPIISETTTQIQW